MRAIVYQHYGPPTVLEQADLDSPEPADGQVRVRVRVAGVNPVDAKQRRGDFAALAPAEFPAQLGNEYAGVVDALGSDVTGLAVGDEVLGSASAQAYAELVVVDAAAVVAKPTDLSWTVAGALPAAAQTAHAAITALTLDPGDTLLIHGAAGGVGTLAVQLARHLGVTVIGTASTGNHEHLRRLGAEPLTYGPGLTDRVAVLAPSGITAALDLVGGDANVTSLALVDDPHRIGTTVDAAAVREHGIQRVGGRSTPALHEIVELAAAGRITLPVDAGYELHDAARAHERIETGHATGKIALTVDSQ